MSAATAKRDRWKIRGRDMSLRAQYAGSTRFRTPPSSTGQTQTKFAPSVSPLVVNASTTPVTLPKPLVSLKPPPESCQKPLKTSPKPTTDNVAKSATQGSPVPNKLKTSNVKQKVSKKPNHTMKSLKKSARGSTGRDQSFYRFWTPSCAERSKRSWLPIETGLPDSPSNSSPTSVSKTIVKSWFSVRQTHKETQGQLVTIKKADSFPIRVNKSLPKTSSPSSPVSQLASMEDEQQRIEKEENSQEPPKKKRKQSPKKKWKEVMMEDGTVMMEKTPEILRKTLKLRVYPNQQQKEELKTWFEIHRLVYNRVATYINKQPTPCSVSLSMISLRNAISTNDDKWGKFTSNNPRYFKAHSDLRQSAFREIATAVKAAKQFGFPKKRKIYFKHKRKKDTKEFTSISARAASVKGGYFFNIFGHHADGRPLLLNSREKKRLRYNRSHPNLPPLLPVPLKYTGEIDIVHEKRLDRYYLCIPFDLKTHDKTPDIQGRVCAIDPGIRTMATCYDVSGRTGITYWGDKVASNKFIWISRKISRVQSHLYNKVTMHSENTSAKTLHRSRRNKRKLIAKLRARLRYLADEMHHLFAKWLCENFDTVLLPDFKTQKMRKKKSRILGKRNVKVLSSWSHYRFKEFLQHKSREYGTNVIICDEYLTSKTCGNCGYINWKLDRAEIYRCSSCNYVAGRDANAARNIFLRYTEKNGGDVSLSPIVSVGLPASMRNVSI